MRRSLYLALCLAAAGLSSLIVGLAQRRAGVPVRVLPPRADRDGLDEAVAAVDRACAAAWQQAKIEPFDAAGWRTVTRRVSLGIAGTTPSLQELRDLELLPEDKRVDAHVDRLLSDRRSSDYLAERLARAYVGTHQGPFLVYRRRRFVSYLSDAIAAAKPYDALVRELVAARGLWTDRPATNFITAYARDPTELAARSTRAFLGLRLDCAQCHDHPFSHWKQRDFAGLAAFYAGVTQNVTGIDDNPASFHPGGGMMMMQLDGQPPAVEPRVPFAQDALGSSGTLRSRLADWITSPQNPYFARAIANRMWMLLLGTSNHRGGVDDLESPARVPGLLEVLAEDFRAHGHRLDRLIRVITRTRAFRIASSGGTDPARDIYAAFPMVPLRPEQLAGALVQMSALGTIDSDAHVLKKLMRFGSTRDFTTRFGDAGEDELTARPGTIVQRLVMMNGRVTGERIGAGPFSGAGRIAMLAASDEARVRAAYLIALTRDPDADELSHFVSRLRATGGQARQRVMEDMLWALVNGTEFAWSH